jgi:NAD(P)H-dependent FMN reductase
MNNQMLNVAIVIGSTRPGRKGEAVGQWIHEIAKKRGDANFKLVDIKDFNLPLLDEPILPSMGQYSKEYTKTWSAKIDSFDAYVFVTAEYNHGIPGALKNAIDFLFKEWNIITNNMVATVRSQVQLSLFTDFENFTKFKPSSFQEKSVNTMLDEVIAWGGALKALRTKV